MLNITITDSFATLQHLNSNHRQTPPDYRALGNENLCFRCDKNNHRVSKCYVDRNKITCTSCRRGDMSQRCI